MAWGSISVLLSHVYVGIADFDRAFTFYSGITDTLGFVLKFRKPDKLWAGWMEKGVARPLFLIGRPFDNQHARPGNGQMVALLAHNRATVDRCYRWAMKHGATDEGGPGLRSHYHPNYYGAHFRDPDGNKLCVCCHDAA